jgi:hypothetical protein
MMTFMRSEWLRENRVPLGLLFVPILLSIVVGELLTLTFPIAFLIGYFMLPKRPWHLWIGSIVMVWAVYGSAVLVGALPGPGEPASGGETVWSFMFETVIFMAVLVLLPLWLGREVARVVGNRQRRARS